MSFSARWRRLDARTWVHRMLVVEVVLLGLVTVVAFLVGVADGVPLFVLFPAALTALAAWVTHAWDEERRWSWWVVMVLTALGAASNLLVLDSGLSWWRVAWLVYDAVFVALLVHPDSTARLDPRPPHAAAPRG